MKRTIGVFLGDSTRRVGTLRFDSQGGRQSSAFEYEQRWLSDGNGFALEPNLPLVPGPQFHKASTSDSSIFHNAIADTEPDGWARQVILRDHAKRRQEARSARAAKAEEGRALTPMDFLLAVDDANRVGALRFQDEGGIFQRAAGEGRRTAPPLIELRSLIAASRAVETNSETAADLACLRGRGTSLGGLRPKCSVMDDDGALAIGKFPSVTDDRSVTKGEVLALQLAKSAGINAADARLVNSDGAPVSLIRRFDRVKNGRLMYVSAATLIGALESTQYAYTDIVDGIRHHAQGQRDIEELWRRVAFSILITNVDDHLHNHGFIRGEGSGQWHLAPAFDINPSPERNRDLKTWISHDAGPEATIDALMSIAGFCQIREPAARKILGDVEQAVSTWRKAGRKLGMTEKELEPFADAFEHSERGAAQAILGRARRKRRA